VAGRVDHEAVLADFEDWLLEDGRASHGTAHLTRKLAELRAAHRVHEDAEERVLRRFGAALIDTLTGILPVDPATDDPLVGGDPAASMQESAYSHGTSSAMDGGATTDHPTEGASWKHPQSRVPATT
jgi:hypothetical protein